MQAEYLTDGVHLYEIAARRTVQNVGTHWRSGGRYGPQIKYVILRDAVTEATAKVEELDVAALTEISNGRR
jgi:hypothetical protein